MPKLPQILAVSEKAALYGSSRLGSRKERVCMTCTTATLPAELQGVSYVIRGEKSYELSNHLGNVLAVVSDRREAGSCTDSLVDFYYADGRSVSDYYPFGMGMDGRTQSGGGYRWGFNGQEKDDEVAGEGNSYTAEFWQYDSRLGRRWNVDPKPNPSINSYACFANNPIYFLDPLGDTLDIGNNDASKNDILSLVSSDNQKYLTFTNNRVGFDFGDLDVQSRANVINADEGMSLINDLITSNKKFLYEASDFALIRNESGFKWGFPMTSSKNNTVNASNGGKDGNRGHFYRPRDGYQGHVIIHPDTQFQEFDESGVLIKKSRASIVFHELAENYERTHTGINYGGIYGAHNRAIEREGKWHGKSLRPGVVNGLIRGRKPSVERMQEMKQLVDEYLGN